MAKEIKGFALEVNAAYTMGFDPITFPMINQNRKIKQMECQNGAAFLAHRDPSPKTRVSFFVGNNVNYKTRGIARFRATILSDYATYYSDIQF